jgi:hypothetical protein
MHSTPKLVLDSASRAVKCIFPAPLIFVQVTLPNRAIWCSTAFRSRLHSCTSCVAGAERCIRVQWSVGEFDRRGVMRRLVADGVFAALLDGGGR